MKRNPLILMFCLVSISCTTTRQNSQAWCDDRHMQNASFGEEAHAVGTFPIRTGQLPRAYDLLSRRRFVEIDRSTFNELTEEMPSTEGGKYYLMRSGIYSNEHASLVEIKAESDWPGRRGFQFRELDGLLTIFSFQGVRRERLFPMPILVRTPYSISSTQAYCYTHF